MARVHKRTARKAYPNQGIKVGDVYYKWTLRPGGRGKGTMYRSLTPPTPAQLTNSDFMRSVYAFDDDISAAETPDDLEEVINGIRELGDEQGEKLGNMPDSLQNGPTGELLQERADNCDQWASDLESARDAWAEAIEARETWLEWRGSGPAGVNEEDEEALDECPEGVDETEYNTWMENQPSDGAEEVDKDTHLGDATNPF